MVRKILNGKMYPILWDEWPELKVILQRWDYPNEVCKEVIKIRRMQIVFTVICGIT